jgi:zinc D-Ala-D-Ala carboxypeptidase
LVTRWKFFSEDELRCKGTGEIHMDELFMDMLVSLRERLKQPMSISSGYRSESHNIAIGGSTKSAHLKGCAVDIVCSGHKAFEIVRLALELGFTGIGVKQNGLHEKRFIHLDTMPKKSISIPRPWIWSYK